MTPHRLQCCIYYIYVINAAFIPGSNPSFPVSKISLRRLACLHGNSDECLCMPHEASLGTVFCSATYRAVFTGSNKIQAASTYRYMSAGH